MERYRESLEQEDFEQIEAYLMDRLSSADRSAFQQRLVSEPWLMQELELQGQLMASIEVGAFMVSKLKKNRKLHFNPAKWLVAASVLLALATGIWYFYLDGQKSSTQLYSKYYKADPGLPLEMGEGDSLNYAFYDGMISYREGDFAKARQLWIALERQSPSDSLSYYLGHADLHLERNEEGISAFQKVRNNTQSRYSSSASWYLSLLYLKLGEPEKAKAILKNIPNYPDAKSLYDKIEP